MSGWIRCDDGFSNFNKNGLVRVLHRYRGDTESVTVTTVRFKFFDYNCKAMIMSADDTGDSICQIPSPVLMI